MLAISTGQPYDDSMNILKDARLAHLEKVAYYDEADYCFVCSKEMWPILRTEMDSLLREGNVYYMKVDKLDDPETVIVVLTFDDSLVDLLAEIQGIKARLSG